MSPNRPRTALRAGIAFLGSLAAARLGAAEPEPSAAPGIRDAIGVTHVAGTYHLGEGDFLEEGADRILALGSRTIKAYLAKPERDYPFGTDWGAVLGRPAGGEGNHASPREPTLLDIARSGPYRKLFSKPFRTYILTAYRPGVDGHGWRRGLSEEEARAETAAFRELSEHLLEAYRGTGKTFVLQHWEGDWAIRGEFDPKKGLDPIAVRGMVDWLNARQLGVDQAREGARGSDVRVYHAVEVNLVRQALRSGRPGVVDAVLPSTRVDLVSYSAWDSQEDPAELRAALELIERSLPPAAPGVRYPEGPRGPKRVYVGEFGAPVNDFAPERVQKTVRGTIETALDWGCPWVVYWQVYCNEARRKPVKANDDVRGFCLLLPDGSRTWAWGYLEGVLAGRTPVRKDTP